MIRCASWLGGKALFWIGHAPVRQVLNTVLGRNAFLLLA